MSVTTLVKVRAWIRKARARRRSSTRARTMPLVDVPGTHVAVSRNRETVERAMRGPSTVRCAHPPERTRRVLRRHEGRPVGTPRGADGSRGTSGDAPRGEIRALSRVSRSRPEATSRRD